MFFKEENSSQNQKVKISPAAYIIRKRRERTIMLHVQTVQKFI